MPKGQEFWNPYRMIPPREENVVRERPLGHHRLDPGSYSGDLECALTTLTPLLVGKRAAGAISPVSFVTSGKTGNDLPCIPGASLKGVIRSLAEIAGNGCGVIGNFTGSHRKCGDPGQLCVTCRIFGMLGGAKGVFMGKVSFGDALPDPPAIPQSAGYTLLLSSPKDRHTAFYGDRNNRKMYHHMPKQAHKPRESTGAAAHMATKVQHVVGTGVRFAFTVTFSNLKEEEIRLLLYCLRLERNLSRTLSDGPVIRGDMAHKIGMGKPVGMGSVRIDIARMRLFSAGSRYSNYEASAGGTTVFEGGALSLELEKRIAPLVRDRSATMEMIRKMMIWDPADPRNFQYPDQGWFRRNPGVGLKKL